MGCNCGNKKGCGCNDKAITIENSKENTCIEQCSEVFFDSCIIRKQPKIKVSIEGVDIEFEQGERLDSIIQKIMLFFQDYNGYKSSAKNFKIRSYTDTSVELTWEKENYNYSIEYKTNNVVTVLPVGKTDKFEIINLQPGEYEFTIITDETEARSITITFQL